MIKLDFSGNDLEYFGSAMFINLRKVFPGLVDLNSKSYQRLLNGKKGKDCSMRKILDRARVIQKELKKTVAVSKRTEEGRREEAKGKQVV